MASSCLCSTAHCSDRDERLACALDSGLDLYGYISLLVVVVDLSGSVLSCADIVRMLGGACDGAPIYNPSIGVEYPWSVRVRRDKSSLCAWSPVENHRYLQRTSCCRNKSGQACACVISPAGSRNQLLGAGLSILCWSTGYTYEYSSIGLLKWAVTVTMQPITVACMLIFLCNLLFFYTCSDVLVYCCLCSFKVWPNQLLS